MKLYLLCLVFVLVFTSSCQVVYCTGEFDATTVVSSVTDGDTFDTTTEGIIRLADINAPDWYDNYTAYVESRDFLLLN